MAAGLESCCKLAVQSFSWVNFATCVSILVLVSLAELTVANNTKAHQRSNWWKFDFAVDSVCRDANMVLNRRGLHFDCLDVRRERNENRDRFSNV